jgi:hypothetical protein
MPNNNPDHDARKARIEDEMNSAAEDQEPPEGSERIDRRIAEEQA